ncbi:hypothetical protein [Allosediminivita pacifica]|uniref:Arginine transporter n=1 Tax=Allosediminivita pacifica TaxID=1267769 RepID=A0A2T6ABJ6_9RHOB|nr:hypothetical protein [Allosediminivita pacifica]PTX41193.1 hypothetical protein C8N44_13134 [Allosediminivita pacifica]GGB24539.1 hypothetical protein GCM10011324_38130 [Allosediminivita pacifica]
MRKAVILMTAGLALAACGGGNRVDRFNSAPRVLYASGPIKSACQSSGRTQASSALCGCIQAVADTTLTGGDQRKAVRFFREPHEAQVVKMSKTAYDDEFWDRYEDFANRAERSCRA